LLLISHVLDSQILRVVSVDSHRSFVAMEVSKKVVSPTVAEIFSTMDYGPAPESDKIVQAWLDDHDRSFGHFINNEWVKPEGKIGSVAGPVIQATGRSEFEDGLGSGNSYHMSVRTGLPDHAMQTKFQSQRPSDVETPVPSI
jgi:hypothetical protein